MREIRPSNVNSFPGARILFNIFDNNVKVALSSLINPKVTIFFPSEPPYTSAIIAASGSFSWLVPLKAGEDIVSVHLEHDGGDEWFNFNVKIYPVRANTFTIETSPEINPQGSVNCQIYDPLGNLSFAGPMVYNGYTYTVSVTPGPEWFEGQYSATVVDDTGIIDVIPAWITRPDLASMKLFYSLPEWQRQILEFIKYEMFSDTEPLAPAAFFTLEEYTRFWNATVREINSIMPKTNISPQGIPLSWADTMMKGTFINVAHALATRSVTVPRWTGNDMPMRDESHLQAAWETRAQALQVSYEEERAYLKGDYLPSAQITVDPFMAWGGSSLAGQSALSQINAPTWYSGMIGAGGSLR